MLHHRGRPKKAAKKVKMWVTGRSHPNRRYTGPSLSHAAWIFVVVFSHSVMSNFAIPWSAARQASLSFTISWSLLKLMSIELVMPSNHHILCCPLILLPSIFSSIRVFSNKSALCIRWPKDWSFSFSIGMNIEPVSLALAPLWAFVSISQVKIKEGRK